MTEPRPMTALFVFLFGFVFCWASIGLTAVPDTISYQGRLTDDLGIPVSDGSYTMHFFLYDAALGGNQLWNVPNGEQQTVLVTDGIYHVQLGVNQPLDSTVFDGGEVWLEVVVEGETLSPRQLITATAFAFKAGDADTVAGFTKTQLDAEYVLEGQAGAVSSIMIADGSVTAADIDGGVGSGVDSDLLDGQQGGFYLDWNNLTNMPAGFMDGTDNDSNASTLCSGSGTYLDGDGNCDAGVDDVACIGCIGSEDVVDGGLTEQDMRLSVSGSGMATIDTVISRLYRDQLNGVTKARVLIVGNGESEGAAAHLGIYVGATSETFSYDCPGSGGRPWTYISPPFVMPSYVDIKYRVTGTGRFFWRDVRLIPVESQQGTVVVAKAGGDYATISDALAAISPTSSLPYVIKVMPGIYAESVTMKSYVHLQGAGRDVTTIQPSSGNGISMDNLLQAMVSGFTIKNGYYGIYVNNTSEDVSILNNRLSGNGFGIFAYNTRCIIRGNLFEANTNNGLSLSYGAPLIQGNRITGNTFRGIYCSNCDSNIMGNTVALNGYEGIWINNSSASPTVKGNVVLDNGWDGILISNYALPTIIGNFVSQNDRNGIAVNSWGRPRIMNNRIYSNNASGGSYTDIWLNDAMASTSYRPIISLNMYDTISGTMGVGYYNVSNAGGLAPAP